VSGLLLAALEATVLKFVARRRTTPIDLPTCNRMEIMLPSVGKRRDRRAIHQKPDVGYDLVHITASPSSLLAVWVGFRSRQCRWLLLFARGRV